MLAEVQGDLGRVLQDGALEDPALCVLMKRTVEARAADGPRRTLFICAWPGSVNVDVLVHGKP